MRKALQLIIFYGLRLGVGLIQQWHATRLSRQDGIPRDKAVDLLKAVTYRKLVERNPTHNPSKEENPNHAD